jgi:6-phosphofructokinase 1
MGRRAGWLAYGAAIAAGEASLVLSVEDIQGDYKAQENVVDPNTGKKVLDPETGAPKLRKIMNVDKVVGRIVQTMRACEDENKEFGVVVLAEGLAELLPSEYIENIEKDDFGNIALGRLNLAGMFAEWVAEKYELQTGRPRKTTGISLGYEARCARPQAFDVLLGSQLGIGAYRALVEEGRTGIMVSVSGQLNIRYISFEDLVDRKTLLTKIRYIDQNSDFYRLARFLESRDAETATR